MTQPVLEPFYFGPDEQLFGVYHPPPDRTRGVGVVVCPPVGQEHIRSHRALLKLSLSLASAGFPVLRFDPLGCGDSAEIFPGTDALDRWRRDVGVAIEELAEGSGVEEIVLCGLRLGASLAAHAIGEHDEVSGLVLWDPVAQGARYVEDLLEAHQQWLRTSFVEANEDRPGEGDEALGFPLPKAALARLALGQADLAGLEHLLVVETTPPHEGARLSPADAPDAAFELLQIDEIPGWVKRSDASGEVAVPVKAIEAIAERLHAWHP